jgi:hypothetical protein
VQVDADPLAYRSPRSVPPLGWSAARRQSPRSRLLHPRRRAGHLQVAALALGPAFTGGPARSFMTSSHSGDAPAAGQSPTLLGARLLLLGGRRGRLSAADSSSTVAGAAPAEGFAHRRPARGLWPTASRRRPTLETGPATNDGHGVTRVPEYQAERASLDRTPVRAGSGSARAMATSPCWPARRARPAASESGRAAAARGATRAPPRRGSAPRWRRPISGETSGAWGSAWPPRRAAGGRALSRLWSSGPGGGVRRRSSRTARAPGSWRAAWAGAREVADLGAEPHRGQGLDALKAAQPGTVGAHGESSIGFESARSSRSRRATRWSWAWR